MKNERRRYLKALALLPLAALLPAAADSFLEIRERGRLRVAVYDDFAPYSLPGGRGIDADIARALARQLGLSPEIAAYQADEDMADDLRNMVWKGHYLGRPPADVMLHVPVDPYLAQANPMVRIFGAYHRETLAVARDPERVGRAPAGSAAVALEVFTRERIGVETASLADAFLLSVLNGRLRENVVHYRSVAAAAAALVEGRVAAVMGERAALEAALAGQQRLLIEAARLSELKQDGWLIGMAVRSGESRLAQALEGALDALRASGEIAAIFARHGISHRPT